MGAKPVKATIATGLKLGKKTPADLTEVRRAAQAAARPTTSFAG